MKFSRWITYGTRKSPLTVASDPVHNLDPGYTDC